MKDARIFPFHVDAHQKVTQLRRSSGTKYIG